MLFCLPKLMAQMQLLPLKTQLVLVDHQVIRLDKCFTPMPLGQTAQSIKAQQPVEILH
jgi:hypothetical protein